MPLLYAACLLLAATLNAWVILNCYNGGRY